MNPFRRFFPRSNQIRKQVYELTSSDLDLSAIWEFCSDEEGIEGQDEATVKPKLGLKRIHALDGSLIAKTEFTFSDGNKAMGFIYASSEKTLPSIQPVIMTPLGQVNFWHGIFKPEKEEKTALITKLASFSDKPFPIRFSCIVTTDDILIDGQLDGFYYFDRSHEIQIIQF